MLEFCTHLSLSFFYPLFSSLKSTEIIKQISTRKNGFTSRFIAMEIIVCAMCILLIGKIYIDYIDRSGDRVCVLCVLGKKKCYYFICAN